jgi:hypothetical protein
LLSNGGYLVVIPFKKLEISNMGQIADSKTANDLTSSNLPFTMGSNQI